MARNTGGRITRIGTAVAGGLLMLVGAFKAGQAKPAAKHEHELRHGTVVAVVLHAKEMTPIVGAKVEVTGVTRAGTTDSDGVAVVHGVPTGRRSVVIWASKLIHGRQPALERHGLPGLSVEFRARRSVIVREGAVDTLVFRLKPSRPVPVTWQWEP